MFLFFQVSFDSLLRGNFFRGLKVFCISSYTDEDKNKSHLSVFKRIVFIYSRSIIATSGWIALNVASLYFGYIDNSALFGADALVFTILSVLWLGKKLSKKAWGYVFIAFFGVVFVLFFDYTSINQLVGLLCFAAALYSATAFSVIFFMTTIIVRHDAPIRVAFHQVLTGAIISILGYFVLMVKLRFYAEPIPEITTSILNNSIICGALYAIAIPRFLRAFLFTEPVVIAVLGYTLPLFVLFFGFFKGLIIKGKDIVSNVLIAFGCYGLIHEEWKAEKKMPHKKPTQTPLYDDEIYAQIKQDVNIERSLHKEFALLKRDFLNGKLGRYEYISKKHEFNKILLEYSKDIIDTDINKITVKENSIIFNINPLDIKLKTDGGARSAPFEILNFGHYEPEDEQITYTILKNRKELVILDIGANIGWFSINITKRFPDAQVFSFEPIKTTYNFLIENLRRNGIKNCKPFNLGLSNEDKDGLLYYFKSGSAIASIENLIDHPSAKQEKCSLKKLDGLVPSLGIGSIDFIKCDVEGAELFVLQGAMQVIDNFSPIIFIEICEEWCRKCGYSSGEIISFLEKYGYGIFSTPDGKLLEKRREIRKIDEGKYNYFFLHLKNHSLLINSLCNKNL